MFLSRLPPDRNANGENPEPGGPGPGFLSRKAQSGERAKGSVGGHQPIANGINNLVGGWGCRGLPDSDRVKRSSRGHHYPGI